MSFEEKLAAVGRGLDRCFDRARGLRARRVRVRPDFSLFARWRAVAGRALGRRREALVESVAAAVSGAGSAIADLPRRVRAALWNTSKPKFRSGPELREVVASVRELAAQTIGSQGARLSRWRPAMLPVFCAVLLTALVMRATQTGAARTPERAKPSAFAEAQFGPSLEPIRSVRLQRAESRAAAPPPTRVGR
jgi:hypothetical protein